MVVSKLSSGARERSNNPYIESILGPCFSKNQKKIFAAWVWFWRKTWKRLRQWKKVSMSRNRNLCNVVLEREKNNSFEISVIIFRYKKCKSLLFKIDFKIAELLTKNILFSLLQKPSKKWQSKEIKETSKVYAQE